MSHFTSLEALLSEFDVESKNNISEFDIYSSLCDLKNNKNIKDTIEFKAELIAFAYCEGFKDDISTFGDTYYFPFSSFLNQDGTISEFPSLNDISQNIIDYWLKRIKEAKNPIFITRYTGLVWELSQKVLQKKPNFSIVKNHIENIFKIADNQSLKYDTEIIKKLKRAIVLSTKYNNKELIEKCKNTIINFEKKISKDEYPGLWGFSYELLIDNKGINLSKVEEGDIINELESKLSRLSLIDIESLNIVSIKFAAEMLARYYKKRGYNAEVIRVLKTLRMIFEKNEEFIPKIQIQYHLEYLNHIYKKFQLKEEMNEIQIKMREIGKDICNELITNTFYMEVPPEQLKEFINSIITDDLFVTLKNIAIHFIPNIEDEKNELIKLSNQLISYSLFSEQKIDDKGRILSTSNTIDYELESKIINHINMKLEISSFFLRKTIEGAFHKYEKKSDEIINFISLSGLFEDDRKIILKKGLEAYFNNDFIISIHLLIPQIEEAIRNLLEYSGGNILKQSRYGGYYLKNLDEILSDEKIINILKENLTKYIKILLTDSRGWNLRNNICHGYCNPNTFNYIAADRVIHVLLCFGLIIKNKELY